MYISMNAVIGDCVHNVEGLQENGNGAGLAAGLEDLKQQLRQLTQDVEIVKQVASSNIYVYIDYAPILFLFSPKNYNKHIYSRRLVRPSVSPYVPFVSGPKLRYLKSDFETILQK